MSLQLKNVEKNGGASAFEVLRHSLGLSATSMGPMVLHGVR